MSSFALENPNTGRTEETFDRFSDDERAAVLARGVGLYEERFDELADHIGREMGKLTRRGVGEFVNEHLDPRQRPDGCGAVAGVAATAARAPRA